MKTTHLLSIAVIAAVALSAFGAEKPFYEKERPARKIQLDSSKKIELKDNVEIVIASPGNKSTAFAASELQKYLSRILNTQVPVVKQPTAGKVSFFLGIGQLSKAAKIDDSALCRDAYIIRTAGDKIYILGKDTPNHDIAKAVKDRSGGGSYALLNEHGTLFGVYEFLERFCGVRFYQGNELFTIVPSAKSVTVPQIDIYDRPDFEARLYSTFAGKLEDNQGKGWAPYISFSTSKALDYLRYRSQTRSIPNCHGLNALFYIERFSKTNPEYFSLHPNGKRYFAPSMQHTGQLCFSSGIMDEIFEDAKAILSGDMAKIKARSPYLVNKYGQFSRPFSHTPGFVFNFMPQDGYVHCRCDKCKPHMKSEQAISNFVWGKAVELANRLKDAGVDGYISTMAYTPCHLPPENLVLPENIIVMTAQNGPWDPANVQAANYKKIQLWNSRSKVNKVWLWNYICKVSSRNLVLPGVPCGTPWALGKYYKSLKGAVNGSYLESECSHPEDHHAIQALTLYVYGKVMWDNDIDVNKIIDEYFTLCYGAAAPEMKALAKEIETTWLTRIGGKTIMNNLGPVNIPPSDNELWNQIYSPKRLAEMDSTLKKAEAKAKNDKHAFERVCYFRKNVYQPLAENHRLYRKRTDSISDFKVGLSQTVPAVVFLQPWKPDGNPFVQTKVTVKDLDNKFQFTFDCAEPNMADIAAVNRQKDDPNIWQDNGIELFINPSDDRINYYHFMVNSQGNITDSVCKKVGSKSSGDRSWDSGAVVNISKNKNGWKAVITIDKAKLGTLNPKGFAVNFNRNRVARGNNGLFTWSPFLANGFHDIERFGRLVPAESIPASIVKNGDFDSKYWPGWGGWQPHNIKEGETKGHDLTTFVFADKSIKLSFNGDSQNKKPRLNLGQTLHQLKPGKKYRLSYYVKLENVVPLSRGGGACVQIWNTTKNFWFPGTFLSGTMPWTLQTFEFQSLPNSVAKTTLLNCNLFNATGTAWFDGIRLEELP